MYCPVRSSPFSPQVVCQTAVSEPLRWVSDIEQFEAADRVHPPVPGSIVFAGSSSIAMWETLDKDFGYFPVLNRGISGSMLADNVQSVYRIVLPYKPPVVVIYAGENDLVEGETPERVLHDYQTFTSIVHRRLPATRVVFVSIKPSIARDSLMGKIRETNKQFYSYRQKAWLRRRIHSDAGPVWPAKTRAVSRGRVAHERARLRDLARQDHAGTSIGRYRRPVHFRIAARIPHEVLRTWPIKSR